MVGVLIIPASSSSGFPMWNPIGLLYVIDLLLKALLESILNLKRLDWLTPGSDWCLI